MNWAARVRRRGSYPRPLRVAAGSARPTPRCACGLSTAPAARVRCAPRRCAAPGVQIAHRDKAIVRLDHREPADLMAFGQAANRGQARARAQQPVVDLPLDAGDDLFGQRAVRTQCQGQHDTSSGRGLARSADRYSRVNQHENCPCLSSEVSGTTRAVSSNGPMRPIILRSPTTGPANRTEEKQMPLIQVRVIKDVFNKDQKRQIINKLTDAMVSVEGENMRGVTWVTIEEVESGDWGIGGNALTTSDVHALARGKAA